MGRIEIKVKGQTLVCETYTLEHAMFFGTLLMSPDELHVYINEEDPDRAFQQMSKRLGDFIEGLKVKLAGTEDQEKIINDEVVNMFSSRMLVRINQNRVSNNLIPDIRYEVAKRLQEVFPLINRTWVNNTAINLEPSDLVSAVALPLFIYMAQVNKVETEAPRDPWDKTEVMSVPEQPVTSTAGQGFRKKLAGIEINSKNELAAELVSNALEGYAPFAQNPAVEEEDAIARKLREDDALVAQILAAEGIAETKDDVAIDETPIPTPAVDILMPDSVRQWLERHPEYLQVGNGQEIPT